MPESIQPTSREDGLSIIIHELKTPLSLIQAHVDTMRLLDREQKYRENFRIISRELQKMNEIILDILHSMNANGAFITDEIQPYAAVCRAVDRFSQMPDHTISYDIQCESPEIEEARITGSHTAFEMVLSNLVKNAMESIAAAYDSGMRHPAVQAGTITFRLAQAEQPPTGALILQIIDNGTGLSPEEEEKIRLSEPFTSKRYGTGIGIEACKRILQSFGGQFGIANNPCGVGCTVTLTFPIHHP